MHRFEPSEVNPGVVKNQIGVAGHIGFQSASQRQAFLVIIKLITGAQEVIVFPVQNYKSYYSSIMFSFLIKSSMAFFKPNSTIAESNFE